jgi:Cytochrome oxidase complex assembly protein 1
MNPPEKKGWFGRNWKWFVPVGCLSMVLMIVVFIAAVVYFAFGSIKSSTVYQEAITKTRSNADVIRELGEPIEPGWLISGTINVNESSGNADLSIPVSGPKKSGTVYVVATKKMGKWDIYGLEVAVEGENKRINLLTSSTE